MKAKRILVPTDFSASAGAALECAIELAKSLGASLAIAHVELSPALKGAYDDEDQPEYYHSHRLLDEIAVNAPTVDVERVLLSGNVVDQILKFVNDRRGDMIVMGTHGQTNSPDKIMGAVAEGVTRQAPCLVIAVKPTAATANKSKQ